MTTGTHLLLRRLRTACFAANLIVFGSVVQPAFAQSFPEGLAAYQNRDYQTALNNWLPLAEQGDPAAQYNIAVMYRNGQGVRQDLDQARSWYRRAADQGHAGAQVGLGTMFANGEGVARSYVQALDWFEKAANQGNSDAQYNMGLFLYRAPGRVSQDLVSAFYWWALASMNGDEDAARGLNELAGQMSTDQIAKAQGRLDNAPPGVVNDQGGGRPSGQQQQSPAGPPSTGGSGTGGSGSGGSGIGGSAGSFPTSSPALSASDESALQAGMEHYRAGAYDQALVQWFPLAERTVPNAQYLIGILFLNGQGVPHDKGEAALWFRRAADQGLPAAQSNLGFMYYQGDGVEQNYAMARSLFEAAAAQDFPNALYTLGIMHANGEGVAQDYVQALTLITRAARNGFAEAEPVAERLRAQMSPDQLAEVDRRLGN